MDFLQMHMDNRLQIQDVNVCMVKSVVEQDILQSHYGYAEEQVVEQQKHEDRCLGNFSLGSKIGQGTFSKVCIAKHKLTNQQVAIKIIEKCKIEDEADKVRLDRQIKIMRKVRHPNIAQLYQIIQTNRHIYLIMQYAARGQLFDHIVAHERLAEFQASNFLLQLLDAIEYIHQLGITHRDLKPENLLLDHKYNIKVTDFGLSNIYAAGTLLKTSCGSPSYACPQMLNAKQYDGLKADIWSSGIILYAMCFGYLPFDNPNITQLYKVIREGKYEVPQSASRSVVDLLSRILEIDPSRRASIDDIRQHPFCRNIAATKSTRGPVPGIIVGLSQIPYQSEIEHQMRQQLGLETTSLAQQIANNKHNDNTCTYYLILQRNLRLKNQSLGAYYATKYNTINRYALIEKFKANYDRKLMNKVQVRKFEAVQEGTKGRKKDEGNKSQKVKKVPDDTNNTNKKSGKSKMVIHSTPEHKLKEKKLHLLDNHTEDENYLQTKSKSYMSGFVINKGSRTETKLKNRSKSKSNSKTDSKMHSRVQERVSHSTTRQKAKNIGAAVKSKKLQKPKPSKNFANRATTPSKFISTTAKKNGENRSTSKEKKSDSSKKKRSSSTNLGQKLRF